MKNIKTTCLFVMILAGLTLFFGCSKSSGPAIPDPSGTNTENLLIGSGVFIDTVNAIYSSNGDNISFYKNLVSVTLDGNLNLGFSYAAGVNQPYGLSWVVGCNSTIDNFGAVSGLGAITSHTGSSYVNATLAQTGSGYVLKLVDNDPATPTVTNPVARTRYYRLYISATVMNTSNAIAGYTVKYQGPF